MQVGVEDNWGIVTSAPVHHQVTSAVKEDPEMAKFVAQQLEALGDEYKKVLAVTDVHLDGRFLSIRTQETALGSLVCDIGMLFQSVAEDGTTRGPSKVADSRFFV